MIKRIYIKEKDKKKWIPKGMKKGTLHDKLGIAKDKKIPMSVINKHLAALHKKTKGEGGPGLSAEELKFEKELNFAKTRKTKNWK